MIIGKEFRERGERSVILPLFEKKATSSKTALKLHGDAAQRIRRVRRDLNPLGRALENVNVRLTIEKVLTASEFQQVSSLPSIKFFLP